MEYGVKSGTPILLTKSYIYTHNFASVVNKLITWHYFCEIDSFPPNFSNVLNINNKFHIAPMTTTKSKLLNFCGNRCLLSKETKSPISLLVWQTTRFSLIGCYF